MQILCMIFNKRNFHAFTHYLGSTDFSDCGYFDFGDAAPVEFYRCDLFDRHRLDRDIRNSFLK